MVGVSLPRVRFETLLGARLCPSLFQSLMTRSTGCARDLDLQYTDGDSTKESSHRAGLWIIAVDTGGLASCLRGCARERPSLCIQTSCRFAASSICSSQRRRVLPPFVGTSNMFVSRSPHLMTCLRINIKKSVGTQVIERQNCTELADPLPQHGARTNIDWEPRDRQIGALVLRIMPLVGLLAVASGCITTGAIDRGMTSLVGKNFNQVWLGADRRMRRIIRMVKPSWFGLAASFLLPAFRKRHQPTGAVNRWATRWVPCATIAGCLSDLMGKTK